MKTRAAVAWEAGKPLEIEMLDLEGPRAGDIKIDEFITYTMLLDDINRAFDLMHEGKSIRSVIHF